MDRSFPVTLNPLAKRRMLAALPDACAGRLFGLVESGIELPEGGVCYAVEFADASLSAARVIAYIDKYGRAFDACEPLGVPPARFPRFRAYAHAGAHEERGVLMDVTADGTETVVASYACENPGQRDERYRLEELSERSGGVSCPGAWMDYKDFMASMYCLFVECGSELFAPALFDMGALLGRLDTADVFDAVNRELLECDAAMAGEGPARCGVELYLAHMLRESGIAGASPQSLAVVRDDACEAQPVARLIRTERYANTFYVDFFYADQEGRMFENGLFAAARETAAARASFLKAESALNRFLLLVDFLDERFEGGSAAVDEESCAAFDAWLRDRICVQAADPAQAEHRASRWDTHLAFARSCEGLRLPYRIGYEFCSTPAGDALGIDLAVPGFQVMPETAYDEEEGRYVARGERERRGEAARYAAHAVILVAAQAFASSSSVGRVAVNALTDGGRDACVMTLDVERAAFLAAFASDEDHAFADPFAMLRACGAHFSFGEAYALETVPCAFERGQGIFADRREPFIHRDDVPFSDEARALAGVARPSDMSIFEDGRRRAFADEVAGALDDGVTSALACLKGIHDRSEDVLVRRICRGLMDGFEAGLLDEHSYLEVKEAFVDAYGLKPLMARAAALIRADDEAQALSVLAELEAKAAVVDGFADTATTCYRFFDSYETRYMYTRHCADDAAGRRVLPLPDEMFLVHDALAQVYVGSIAGADAALDHARRCIELAPSRAQSYLRAARAHFMRGEYREEAAMCARALEVAWNPDDAGLAWYWAAYAFWKLERYDAAAASYRRCAMVRSNMVQQAMVELEELLESVKGLQRHTEAEENAILRKEGMPVGSLASNCESMLELARAAADSGCNALCCVMAASGMRVIRDDALMPTVKSFSPEER